MQKNKETDEKHYEQKKKMKNREFDPKTSKWKKWFLCFYIYIPLKLILGFSFLPFFGPIQ